MHTCPALRNFCQTTRSSVASRSQSSKISTGAWPPSSIVIRFTPSAARRIRCLPTAVEPVKLTLRMSGLRSEEHTSELQSLMRISYAVFCLKKKKQQQIHINYNPLHTKPTQD